MRSLHVLPFLFAAFGLLSTTGCKSDCEKFYDKLIECEGKEGLPEKEEFIKECDGDKDKEEAKDSLACLSEGGCGDFKDCLRKAAEKRWKEKEKERVKEDIDKIKKAVDEKNFAETPDGCWGVDKNEDADEDLKAACKDFGEKAYDHLKGAVEKIRDDRSDDENLWKTCSDLTRYAEGIGEEKKQKVELLCEEAQKAKDVKATIDKAQANIDAKTAEMPFECNFNIEQLEKIDSDWAKASTKEMVDKCFLELGKIIMEKKLPESTSWCDFTVKDLYKSVTKYKIADPDMDKFMEQARTLKCDQ